MTMTSALILCDSQYGNTATIAQAMTDALRATTAVRFARLAEASAHDLSNADLLIVGSPTQGGRPTQALQTFIKNLPDHSLSNIKLATFDTRMDAAKQSWWLRWIMGMIGYAATPLAASLTAKGATLIAKPEGFIVEGKEGPNRVGETERAAAWSVDLLNTIGG